MQYDTTFENWADYNQDGFIDSEEWMMASINEYTFYQISGGNESATVQQANEYGIPASFVLGSDINEDGIITLDEFIFFILEIRPTW